MIIKTYKANNNLTVPIVVGGKIVKYVDFSDANHTYVTKSEQEQTALESLGSYGTTFKLVETKSEKKEEVIPLFEPAVFDDVTSLIEAKDILKGEPYNVAHQQLRTPESVMAKATSLNISFPNLKL